MIFTLTIQNCSLSKGVVLDLSSLPAIQRALLVGVTPTISLCFGPTPNS